MTYAIYDREATLKVYDALTSEREYQVLRWGNFAMARPRENVQTVGEYLVYMDEYLRRAKEAFTNASNFDHYKVLEMIRKVTTLGVVCMEHNGVEHRNISSPGVVNAHDGVLRNGDSIG